MPATAPFDKISFSSGKPLASTTVIVADPADSSADEVKLAAKDEKSVGCVVGDVTAELDGDVVDVVGVMIEEEEGDEACETDEEDEAAAELTWLLLIEVSSII
jgi:hypothetical protein